MRHSCWNTTWPHASSIQCQACQVNPRYCRALLTSWKISAAPAWEAHLSIRQRADCQKREACGFQLFFQETKRPLPWPLRRILSQMVLGYPSSRLCEVPPAPVPMWGGEGQGATSICSGHLCRCGYLGGREAWGCCRPGLLTRRV